MLSVTNVPNSVFQNSNSIQMTPIVSAEWNMNLFNQPYITMAGTGSSETFSSPSTSPSTTITDVSGQPASMTNVTTKNIQMSGTNLSISYTVTTANSASAYKIITYMKTDSDSPIQVNAYAKGTNTQYGSTTVDINAFGYIKVLTYIGSSGTSDGISSFTYTININTYNLEVVGSYNNSNYTGLLANYGTYSNVINGVGTYQDLLVAGNTAVNSPINIYFTQPEAYETTYFDYQYNAMWPTDSPFTHFRPGESYVGSGNTQFSFPANFRKINTSTITGLGTVYPPITPVIQNPTHTLATPPLPLYKNVLASEMAPYKYFVSNPGDGSSKSGYTYTNSTYSPSISAKYINAANANKLVLKFNTLVSTPKIDVYLDSTKIATAVQPDSNGLITLYYNGTTWTTNKWSTMPTFQANGYISLYKSFNKITLTQTATTLNSTFQSYTNANFISDAKRMHLVEVSPRLEIDLSSYVMDLSITKQLDSKNNYIPISSINPNDASITLSSIPLTYQNAPIPIFSSQSNLSSNILYNMMRKNIKFYFGWNLISYTQNSGTVFLNSGTGQYVPAGVYWSNSWAETDIQTVKVECYDIVNYLQTIAVPDYVASKKSLFDIISTILDLAGYTDYDYDSLYHVCNDSLTPVDVYYYFSNSQASTVYDALSELFLSHQIGAYIDEFGVMKFLSLSDIMKNKISTMDFIDSSIVQGGYSITNKTKPGAITISYQEPKILQSLALQNATDVDIQNSPSFVYTTSNDVVWSQKNADSVGYNYLSKDMLANENVFSMNNNSLLDIFHTYLLNNDGYGIIENEVVSFLYKEYKINSLTNSSIYQLVYPKTDIELSSYVNAFIKKYSVGLSSNSITITGASGNGTNITYNATNNFSAGQRVSIINVTPSQFNIVGKVVSSTGSSFTLASNYTGTYVSGGTVVSASDTNNNVQVTPTGKIANVQRGMFGTVASDHKIITSKPGTNDGKDKYLSEATLDNSYALTTGTSTTTAYAAAFASPDNPKIAKVIVVPPTSGKALIYPSSYTDPGFCTYSVKFDFNVDALNANSFNSNTLNLNSAGLFFNQTGSSGNNAYFVELIQMKVDTQYKYYIVFYKAASSSSSAKPSVISWTDVTGTVNYIQQNFEKVLYVNSGKNTNNYSYGVASDQYFNLRVVHKYSDGTDGEVQGEILEVFLNNVEITGWQIPIVVTNPSTVDSDVVKTWTYGGVTYKWGSTPLNTVTGLRQHVNFISATSKTLFTGSKFGFFTSIDPVLPQTVTSPVTQSTGVISAQFREIYGTEKPLIERSVNYYYQDREFLNGLVQKQNLFSKYKSYMVQTNPDVVGMNYYDVQYQTPAATSVDVLPIEYLWQYFPGEQPIDQQYYQKQLVDEYSLSYSTPINTGFRAKMAITNNCGHMVYLTKQSDAINQFTVTLNLWTHEVVAPSDPQVISKILDPANSSEVIQIDSPWIQSKKSAEALINVIKIGNDGFSKDTSIQIFGNPLIQVGDIISVSYSLAGISGQKYLVHEVSHVFQKGLKTTLILNSLQTGLGY